LSPKGTHIVADFWNVDSELINDRRALLNICREAARLGNLSVCAEYFYTFEPSGLTIVFVLKESSFTVHTYPEVRYIAIDIFCCGTNADPYKALEYLTVALQPGKVNPVILERGQYNGVRFVKANVCSDIVKVHNYPNKLECWIELDGRWVKLVPEGFQFTGGGPC